MKQLVIIGAGGFGRDVLDWSRQAVVKLPVRGFLDDNPRALDRFTKGVSLLGGTGDYTPEPDDVFLCAMGVVEHKRRCAQRLIDRGGVFVRLVHYSAVVADSASLGDGVILCPNVVIAADACVGDFVSINLNSTVGHDAVIGHWSQIHCHADITGAAVLGERVTVGSHASILPGVKVGDDAVIGAGSVVTRDVPAGATVFGVPARVYAQREPRP